MQEYKNWISHGATDTSKNEFKKKYCMVRYHFGTALLKYPVRMVPFPLSDSSSLMLVFYN